MSRCPLKFPLFLTCHLSEPFVVKLVVPCADDLFRCVAGSLGRRCRTGSAGGVHCAIATTWYYRTGLFLRRWLTSSAPGLQFSTAVIDPKSGYPLVTLSNSYTFTYSADLRAWLRIADDSFVQSELYSSLSGGASGLLCTETLSREQVCDVVPQADH